MQPKGEMMKNIKKQASFLTIIILFFAACGPQYVRDPNAFVLVTSKYENEPERVILDRGNCKPQIDCSKKSEAECAAALYNSSKEMISEAAKLTEKRLYLSARLEYMHALCRLFEAEIRIKRAKTTNYNDFKVISALKLEELVAKNITHCEKMQLRLQWK